MSRNKVQDIMHNGVQNPAFEGKAAMTTKEVDSNRPKQRMYMRSPNFGILFCEKYYRFKSFSSQTYLP